MQPYPAHGRKKYKKECAYSLICSYHFKSVVYSEYAEKPAYTKFVIYSRYKLNSIKENALILMKSLSLK